jgi:valyl-tRNA synthetase
MLELDGDYQPDVQMNAQDNARSSSDRDPATAASGESPFELRRVSEDETPSSAISSLSTWNITLKAATTMLPMVIPSLPELDDDLFEDNIARPKFSGKSHQLCEEAFDSQGKKIEHLIETVKTVTTQYHVLMRAAVNYNEKSQKLMEKQQGEIHSLSIKEMKQKLSLDSQKKELNAANTKIKALEKQINSKTLWMAALSRTRMSPGNNQPKLSAITI